MFYCQSFYWEILLSSHFYEIQYCQPCKINQHLKDKVINRTKKGKTNLEDVIMFSRKSKTGNISWKIETGFVKMMCLQIFVPCPQK